MPDAGIVTATTNTESSRSGLIWLWLSLTVAIVDQVSKFAALAWLELYRPVVILPVFNFTLAFNKGAAFSFLSDASGWQRWFFVLIGVVAVTVIVAWLRRLTPAEKIMGAGLSLILGGALGNLGDRIGRGYVVDFLDAHYQQWHFPTFNIADSAITIGVILVLFAELFLRHKASH